MESSEISVVRLNSAKPIIRPSNHAWENWMTTNATCIYLERSTKNDPLIEKLLPELTINDSQLSKGVIVIFYRACPREFEGYFPSTVGLALFTPEYDLLKRYDKPVLEPSRDPQDFDYASVDDPRVTRLGDIFYMVYCGSYKEFSQVQVCVAKSKDLLTWVKCGPIKGNVYDRYNKDGVLFDDTIEGYYYLLHRPSVGRQSDFAISLARSRSIEGDWEDCGTLFTAREQEGYDHVWNGAGTVPIPLGDNRYIMIYHTGYLKSNGDRTYTADAALLDFNNFNISDPSTIVVKRLEHLMVPQVSYEKKAPDDPDHQLDVIFPCGSFEYENDIHLIYGAANAYVMAAKLDKTSLLNYLLQ